MKLYRLHYRKRICMKAENCAVIILAAGASTRLGRPKQLLAFQSQSLIKHIVSEAKNSVETVLVVTGSGHDAIAAELKDEPVVLVENKQWEQGMGTSISKGIAVLKSLKPAIKAAVLAVCDQPFVSAALFAQMQALQNRSGKKIVACSYAETVGTPVLFEHTYFDALQQLSGQEGAKKLVQQFIADVTLLPFPQG